jgi:tRNA U34 5-carboxymethylaminomethyl modifying enzyme MnmG/GidA
MVWSIAHQLTHQHSSRVDIIRYNQERSCHLHQDEIHRECEAIGQRVANFLDKNRSAIAGTKGHPVEDRSIFKEFVR